MGNRHAQEADADDNAGQKEFGRLDFFKEPERDRAAGQPSDPDTIARELTSTALAIPPPCPDEVTGYGRIRLDVDPPTWISPAPSAGQPVGDSARFDIAVDDAGTIEASGVSVDGVALAEVQGILHQRLSTSALAPGPHTAVFWARDMAGNRSEQTVAFVRAATPPGGMRLPPPPPPSGRAGRSSS